MTAAGRPTALPRAPAGRLGGRLPRALAAALIATLLAVGLGLSALRNQIIDLRYRAAALLGEERALEESRRELAVRLRQLRDPKHLASLARRRGFVLPERVIQLEADPEGAGQ